MSYNEKSESSRRHCGLNHRRRHFIKQGLSAAGSLLIPIVASSTQKALYPAIDARKEIKIGILFSQSGIMQIYGRDQLRAALLAISDINRSGGIHGAKLVPVIRDPASHWPSYSRYTRELLAQNINFIWGCAPSASREATLPVVQRGGALLFYGVFYEGRECSPNMIATGAVPNQLTAISIPWMMKLTGKRVYIVGSNYIFPHTISKQARINIYQHGGKIVGNQFFSLDQNQEAQFADVVTEIAKLKPDWILSNLVGVNTGAFLKAFKKAGLSAQQIPILHTVLMETEVAAIGTEFTEGHYSSVNYYQTIDTSENRDFVKHVQSFSSALLTDTKPTSTVTSIVEGVYLGAMLHAKAMRRANSAHPVAVREAARGMQIKAPSGDVVRIDPENLHAWLRPRIGKVNAQGLFDIVYQSPDLIRPEVFNPVMDAQRSCIDGGRFYIRGTRVKLPRVTRPIIAQSE